MTTPATPNPWTQVPLVQIANSADMPDPLVDRVSSTLQYIGYVSEWGVSEDEPKWMIVRISTAGTITLTEYADRKNYTSKWSDRASLTYGR